MRTAIQNKFETRHDEFLGLLIIMCKELLTPHIILEMLRIEQQQYAACAA
jgi:hypothetical protein